MMLITKTHPSRAALAPIFALMALALALSVSACKSSEKFDAAKAQSLLDAGARIVDVRTPGEFAGGHLKNAINIPVQVLHERLAELEPRDKPVVVYCRSGNRSGAAASILRANGFTAVRDIRTMAGWPLR